MRLRLKIDHTPHQKLPINYQYLISSWIYSLLYSGDKLFATWLHENGYQLNGRKYKHFCFSMLKPQRFKIHQKEKLFELQEGPTDLLLSFNIDKPGADIIKELFKNNVLQLISGKSLRFLGTVSNIELIKSPHFTDCVKLRTQTPICVSIGGEGEKYPIFLSPDDERYTKAFISNLVNKANAYLGEEKYIKEQVNFRLLSPKVKTKLWTIKGIAVKGYCFDFTLLAPKELIEIGYYAGYGTQNSSLGMGLCEILAE